MLFFLSLENDCLYSTDHIIHDVENNSIQRIKHVFHYFILLMIKHTVDNKSIHVTIVNLFPYVWYYLKIIEY